MFGSSVGEQSQTAGGREDRAPAAVLYRVQQCPSLVVRRAGDSFHSLRSEAIGSKPTFGKCAPPSSNTSITGIFASLALPASIVDYNRPPCSSPPAPAALTPERLCPAYLVRLTSLAPQLARSPTVFLLPTPSRWGQAKNSSLHPRPILAAHQSSSKAPWLRTLPGFATAIPR